jgi:hypothetical protein
MQPPSELENTTPLVEALDMGPDTEAPEPTKAKEPVAPKEQKPPKGKVLLTGKWTAGRGRNSTATNG